MYANPALPSVVCFMKLFCLITLPYRGGDSDYYISCCLYLIPHVCVTSFSFARVLYASRNRCRSKQGTPRVSKITFIKNATMANRSSVLYSTFSKWNVSHVIGHTSEFDQLNREIVVKVWCKLCAKHSEKIRKELRGRSVGEVDKYINGTDFITKYTVTRHLRSQVHQSSLGKWLHVYLIRNNDD